MYLILQERNSGLQTGSGECHQRFCRDGVMWACKTPTSSKGGGRLMLRRGGGQPSSDARCSFAISYQVCTVATAWYEMAKERSEEHTSELHSPDHIIFLL